MKILKSAERRLRRRLMNHNTITPTTAGDGLADGGDKAISGTDWPCD
jgi:hypothetical protein